MNNVLFRRGDQTFINQNVPLNDGQIIFNETDEAIYLDSTIGGSVVRKRYGGGNLSRSDIDMALSTTSENPIANKVVANAIGNLPSLQTDIKTNLVGAINEVDTKVSKTEVLISNSGDAYDSTKGYAVGDLCIYNNVLYRCITACSAGSWEVNQSCFTQDTLVNVVDSLSVSSSSTPTVNNGTLRIYKLGKIVTVTWGGGTLQTSGYDLGYLESKYRPITDLGFAGYADIGGKVHFCAQIFKADGKIRINPVSAVTQYAGFSITYIANE